MNEEDDEQLKPLPFQVNFSRREIYEGLVGEDEINEEWGWERDA